LLLKYYLLVVSDLSHTRELSQQGLAERDRSRGTGTVQAKRAKDVGVNLQRLTGTIESLREATADGDIESMKKGLQKHTNILPYMAYAKSSKGLTKRLLRIGADASFVNESSRTPLHAASTKGYADIVKMLLYHEAEFNAGDKYGRKALFKAVRLGHKLMVGLLLAMGRTLTL
jgi:ankyrin repeat protein